MTKRRIVPSKSRLSRLRRVGVRLRVRDRFVRLSVRLRLRLGARGWRRVGNAEALVDVRVKERGVEGLGAEGTLAE